MMGMTSLHNIFAGWRVRITMWAPATRQPVRGRALDADEMRAFHQALHTAYGVFAQRHPEWTQRGFDVSFLRTDAVTMLMHGWAAVGAAHDAPTGMDLARLWERKYGLLLCGADRVTRVARLADAANVLLTALAAARVQQHEAASICC